VDKLRKLPFVRAALSERMMTRLKSMGVLDETERPSALSLCGGGGGLLTSTAASEALQAPAVAAALKARCAQLGLEGDGAQTPGSTNPGPPRLPPCTLSLALHQGLWERFRKSCGTPLPVKARAVPCQLRPSSGGGHYVAPTLLAAVAGAAATG